MEYVIVESSNSIELAKEVTEKLVWGWELYGPLIYTPTNSGTDFLAQAMVKKVS